MEVPSLVDVILASCVVHNICEVQNNNFQPDWEEAEVVEEPIVPIDDIVAPDAENIRDDLTKYFT